MVNQSNSLGDVGTKEASVPRAESLKRLKRHQAQRKWVEGLLVSAQQREWYGIISIKIKRGMIDVVLSEESLKPPTPEDEGG